MISNDQKPQIHQVGAMWIGRIGDKLWITSRDGGTGIWNPDSFTCEQVDKIPVWDAILQRDRLYARAAGSSPVNFLAREWPSQKALWAIPRIEGFPGCTHFCVHDDWIFMNGTIFTTGAITRQLGTYLLACHDGEMVTDPDLIKKLYLEINSHQNSFTGKSKVLSLQSINPYVDIQSLFWRKDRLFMVWAHSSRPALGTKLMSIDPSLDAASLQEEWMLDKDSNFFVSRNNQWIAAAKTKRGAQVKVFDIESSREEFVFQMAQDERVCTIHIQNDILIIASEKQLTLIDLKTKQTREVILNRTYPPNCKNPISLFGHKNSLFVGFYENYLAIWALKNTVFASEGALETPVVKKCPRCEASVKETGKFCNKCGYKFTF